MEYIDCNKELKKQTEKNKESYKESDISNNNEMMRYIV